MSPDELAELADQSLDGEVDDSRWAAARAAAGPAADEALARARALREAVAGLSIGELPLPLADLASRLPPRRRPGARWPWTLPLAAALMFAILTPFGLQSPPEERAYPAVLHPGAESAEATGPRIVFGAPEGGSLASVGDQPDEEGHKQVGTDQPPAAWQAAAVLDLAATSPSVTGQDSGSAVAFVPVAAERLADHRATTATPASPFPAPDGQMATTTSLDGLDLNALAEEAREFTRSREVASAAPVPLPDAVLMEALASEATLAGPDDPALSARISLAMALESGGQPWPLLSVTLTHEGGADLPLRPGMLVLESLDASGVLLHQARLPMPGPRLLLAGERMSWTTTLAEDDLPPQAATALRLRLGSQVSSPVPWGPNP